MSKTFIKFNFQIFVYNFANAAKKRLANKFVLKLNLQKTGPTCDIRLFDPFFMFLSISLIIDV